MSIILQKDVVLIWRLKDISIEYLMPLYNTKIESNPILKDKFLHHYRILFNQKMLWQLDKFGRVKLYYLIINLLYGII